MNPDALYTDWVDKIKAERVSGINRPLTQSEHDAVNARYPGTTLEYCCECGQPTGRAGTDNRHRGDHRERAGKMTAGLVGNEFRISREGQSSFDICFRHNILPPFGGAKLLNHERYEPPGAPSMPPNTQDFISLLLRIDGVSLLFIKHNQIGLYFGTAFNTDREIREMKKRGLKQAKTICEVAIRRYIGNWCGERRKAEG